MRITILLVGAITIIFILSYILMNFDYEYVKKKKQKKCFKIFQNMYPLSLLCPGKKSCILCYDCPHYMDNHCYKIDKLPKSELDINGFQNKDWGN